MSTFLLKRCNLRLIPHTELSQADRDAVEQMDFDADQNTNDVAAASQVPPPGEEGYDLSHEGGEFSVFDDLAADIASMTGRQ